MLSSVPPSLRILRSTKTSLSSYLVAALVVTASLCACNDSPANPDSSPLRDAGGEPISMPDLGEGDGGTEPLHIGDSCNPDNHRCAPGQVCIALGEGVGVCALPDCTMEITVTSQREDSCPEGTACAEAFIEGAGGDDRRTYCLRICEPNADRNTCAARHAGLACAPASIFATGYTEVCGALACHSDVDCNPGIPTEHRAICDTNVNLCFPKGASDADIGSPCHTSTECGEGQYCLPELNDGEKVDLPGGYCTKVGCRYGAPWSCPEGSGCYSLGAAQALSLCMAVGCTPGAPAESDECRDQSDPVEAYACLTIDGEGVCWLQPD